MKVIGVCNQKGGAGKSTLVRTVGSELARQGVKTLLVDVDPQASVTRTFNVQFDQNQIYVEDLLSTTKLNALEAPAQVEENLYLIPTLGAKSLSGIESTLGTGDRMFYLKRHIETLSKANFFDVALLDPPGTTCNLMCSVLTAANWVIVPLRPTFSDVDATISFIPMIKEVSGTLNPDLEVKSVFFNQVPKQSAQFDKYTKKLGGEGGVDWADLVSKNCGRFSIKVGDAPERGVDVIKVAGRTGVAGDYKRYALEVKSWL